LRAEMRQARRAPSLCSQTQDVRRLNALIDARRSTGAVEIMRLRLHYIKIIVAVAAALLAIGSQLWHPFYLGFYHDDWSLFVLPHALLQEGQNIIDFFTSAHRDRPGFAIFSFITVNLWNGETWSFHVIKSVINLATACSIVLVITAYQDLLGRRSLPLAILAGSYWLVVPWSLGYTLWPTAAFLNISLLFVCISAFFLKKWWERNVPVTLILSAAFFAGSVFFYQSSWGSIFLFVLLIGMVELFEGRSLKRLWIPVFLFFSVQLGAMLHSIFTSPKTLDPNIISCAVANLKTIFEFGKEQFGARVYYSLWVIVSVILISALIEPYLRASHNRLRIFAAASIYILGICLSALLYATAGYLIKVWGVESRTTQFPTFWTAMSMAIFFSPSQIPGRSWDILGVALFSVVLSLSAAVYWNAAEPWAQSRRMQQDVLSRVGVLSNRLMSGDVVVSDVPLSAGLERRESVPVFGASWDITAAVKVSLGDFAGYQIIPPYPWQMSWAPGTFTVSQGWVAPAHRLLVWKWKSGTLHEVHKPAPDTRHLFQTSDDE